MKIQKSFQSINTIRTLTIDAVEKAESGHMGMPLGSAPMAYVLWKNHLNINTDTPEWFNRDRFVLSAGHGSMLQYSLLHLSGFDLTLNDLKEFRQFKSRTPGHPEFGYTPGVDVSTGPLGQGMAMAVGMALAEKKLAYMFNRDNFPIIDHYTYVICGDGDLMEGVASEASSLAGHLSLEKLIVLYDSNDSSLDAPLNQSFSENIRDKYEAYGWEYLMVEDGNDLEAIDAAIRKAKTSRCPTIIEVKTIIGFGIDDIQGTHKAHSDPIGEKAVKKAKKFYNWDHKEDFYVPSEVYEDFSSIKENGKEKLNKWTKMLRNYEEQHPNLLEELERIIRKESPVGWKDNLPDYTNETKAIATRKAAGATLNKLADSIPEIFGGAADLSSSTKMIINDSKPITKDDFSGRNVYFGVREFAMAAIANGMALHHLRPFVSTYFVFSDYMKPAIRLSALMGLPVTYLFTHDSIAVGYDGPSHQPVEQLATFRSMPNTTVIRPADANETVLAWKVAIESQSEPTVMVLARQDTKVMEESGKLTEDSVSKGGYVLHKAVNPDGLIIATGSEVELAMEAKDELLKEKINISVVSLPSWELFEKQSDEYKETVLPKELKKRLVIEMASHLGWREYAGDAGRIMSVDDFGESGNPKEVVEKFGFTVDNIVKCYKEI